MNFFALFLQTIYINNYVEANRGAEAQRLTIKTTNCGFDRLEETKYLIKFIFLFLRSGVQAKRGLEFRHSTSNAFKIPRKVENGVSSH